MAMRLLAEGETVYDSSKGEGLPFELVQHFCYKGGAVVSFKAKSGCSMLHCFYGQNSYLLGCNGPKPENSIRGRT